MNQFRQLYAKVINDKHDDVMAKFGAILAQGILDAGQCSNRAAAGLPLSVTEGEIKLGVWLCMPHMASPLRGNKKIWVT